MIKRPILLIGGLTFFTGAGLLIITPTLNLDDLFIAWFTPQSIANDGFAGAFLKNVLNSYFGAAEMRSYGFARLAQFGTMNLFGSWPPGHYAFMIVIVLTGSICLFRVAARAADNETFAFLAAGSWAASPAILPALKTEHHILYIAAPFTCLFAWLWVMTTCDLARVRWHVVGALLLTASWLFGEFALISTALIATLVIARLVLARRVRLAIFVVGQCIIAVAGLGFYIAYQLLVVRDYSRSVRFPITIPDSNELIDRGVRFADALWQSARALAGLAFHDAELGGAIVDGFSAVDRPIMWILFVGLATAFLWRGFQQQPATKHAGSFSGAMLVLAIGALGVPASLALLSGAPMPPRYFTAFWALLPVCLMSGLMYLSPPNGRRGAAILAAFVFALFLTSLIAAERSVNSEVRDAIVSFRARAAAGQDVLVLRSEGFPPNRTGWPHAIMPGLISIYASNLPNPTRSAWMLMPMLEMYANTQVTFACELAGNDRIVTFARGRPMTSPASRVYAMGLRNPKLSTDRAVTLELSKTCN